MKAITFNKRSVKRVAAVAATLALLAGGAQTFADDPEPGTDSAPPGTPIVIADDAASNMQPLVTTGGTNWDPTILTKFIPARAFDTEHGVLADYTDSDGTSCINAPVGSQGALTPVWAPVELPDGSRIKRLTYFGHDNSIQDVAIELHRQQFTLPLLVGGTNSRANTVVTSFSTSGTSVNPIVVASADNLDEVVGTPSQGFVISFLHRFHSIEVTLDNVGSDQALCGIEVQYQVAVSSADPGNVFYPVGPNRVYDSRIGTYPNSGLLAPNANRVIPIQNGFDLDGVAIPAQANFIPTNATAITYNVAVTDTTGGNFLSVTPGNAAAFTTATINYASGNTLNNGSTVGIAPDRTIKLWAGPGASTNIVIDITGYYAPPIAPPNMGN